MRFAIRLLRFRGRILPWRDVMNQPQRVGDLRVEECLDDDLRRYLRTARLVDTSTVTRATRPPELFDVKLVAMSPQAFTLAGFEREHGAEFAQSWLVTTVPRDDAPRRSRAAEVSVLPPPSPGRRLLQERAGVSATMPRRRSSSPPDER